ncbi:MAG: redoxin domain-containing protein [Chloroflexota bacterium]
MLYFYPKDDTPGCTTESCQFRDAYEEYQQAGAHKVGHQRLGQWLQVRVQGQVRAALHAHRRRGPRGRRGVRRVQKQNYGKAYMGIERATFLVDPEVAMPRSGRRSSRRPRRRGARGARALSGVRSDVSGLRVR